MLPIQLQSAQLAKFERNGFLIVPDLVTQKEIETFLQHEEDPATQDLRQGLRTHLSDPYGITLPTILISQELLDSFWVASPE